MFDLGEATFEILYLVSMIGSWLSVIALLLIGVALLRIVRKLKRGLESLGNKKDK